MATLLLTGARLREVLGLEVENVSFDRKAITSRPNAWRRLKTRGSARTLLLWPQLEEILRPYVFDLDRPPARLLFPSLGTLRHRSDVVEYRIEQHAATLGDRLEVLRGAGLLPETLTRLRRHVGRR